MIRMDETWKRLEQIRIKKPLVLNITNVVVTNITANVLLALGASPAMSVSEDEIEELVSLAGALVLNLGTPSRSQVRTMDLAGKKARELGVPVVLDPVGAGASKTRTETPLEFLEKGFVDVLRGNASEIMALAGSTEKPRGVDSLHKSDQAVEAAFGLSQKYGCVVCVSGEKDVVVSGQNICRVLNGQALMTLITGMGCSSTCLVAAFAAVEKDLLKATAMGMAVMGLCGELAAKEAQGPGTLETIFLDKLYSLEEKVLQGIRVE
ncbi:hydroxyethylthiazole kinase [Desulfonatronovibrio hydrogenovorans]|uniref:hydroxyethylthiazole kinase n=1 Tax=Desulfonatronovibrio hydrogenovorans TaxID=53245 RepID=UPI00048D4FA4|nr:hydroxyethylthiazole kinase [Desulfonatronovibrio hydrogenovorans]